MKVYILGCNDRAALTFAREIGKLKIDVEILSFDTKCITLKSKFIKKHHLLNQKSDVNEIYREIVNIIKKGSFVIPINDYFKRESYN